MGKEGEILDGKDGIDSFFEEGGKRWFRTGDIGEFDMEGRFNWLLNKIGKICFFVGHCPRN